MLGAAAGVLLAGGALVAPASAQDRWDWRGPERDRPFELVGPGVGMLIPELRDNIRGRAFVRRNFDWDHDGVVSFREARAANRAFLEAAGPDRGRFDWDRRWHDDGPPPPPPRAYHGGWDREGMRGYHFRQGRYGATFTLGDVLFETGSARLRPAALARLRPLAGYLRSTSGARLRIDGFTDSVGSAEANLQLSRDRARSVADALASMGADARGFHLEGHGEDLPVASNMNAAGRQQNRRVEVTLVGARASAFD